MLELISEKLYIPIDGDAERGFSNKYIFAMATVPQSDVICDLAAEPDEVSLTLTGKRDAVRAATDHLVSAGFVRALPYDD
jgi:hypothetical protein